MIREFFAGVRILGRGFGMWRTRPKLLALGLVPALIAFAVLAGALIPFALTLGSITDWITPFADDWVSPWQEVLRFGLGAVLLVAALALAGAVFTMRAGHRWSSTLSVGRSLLPRSVP